MQNNQYILVTGGAGYIGSHTIVELIENGYTPIIADDLRNANEIVLKNLETLVGQSITIYKIDVCIEDQLSPLFEKYNFKGIIHFAADKAVGESVENPLKYYHNNIGGLVNVLKLAYKFKVVNFVFSSSCTVYGEPHEIKEVSETTKLSKANSPYGSTKLICEQIIDDFTNVNKDFSCIALRYFNPIGAHPSSLIGEFPLGKPNNLLPYITQTAIGKLEKLTVFGNNYPTPDGTCIRDYIHVCDLANAHVKAIDFLKTQNGCNEKINIGTGKGSSVLEVINCFEKISNQKLNWQFGERRAGDVVEIFANAEKSSKVLNWKPRYNLEDAVKHAWSWENKLSENE